MRSTFRPQPTTLAILIAAIFAPTITWADQLPLVQYPAGTAYKTPIPNVILTVDTSGSMDTKDGGASVSRLGFVRNGLKTTLVDSAKYDGQFRLAWQSFVCNDIPSSNGNCGGKNAMGKYADTHKTNFGTWVSKLTSGTASGTTNTPSHMTVFSAGEYLKKTGADSPWNATPGISDPKPLDCRRAYHIFLTDGGWNYSTPTKWYPSNPPSSAGASAFSFNTKIKASDPLAQAIQNADGKNTTLPDSVSYSVAATDPQTQVYRDAYGANNLVKNTADNVNYAYPTLADMAFYYWATDLQPIADKVSPKIRKSGAETFTSGTGASAKSVTLDEYWNPKNDPATWQHLVQYTIGYGPSASNLNQSGTNSTTPAFTGGTFGMYTAGFTDLVTGIKKWDDPTNSTADSSYDKWRPQEMWHMAINSRGKFFPVAGGDLSGVFSDIFDDIIADTSAPISGFTSASGSISRIGTESYQTTYVAADDAASNDNRWYGYVTSDTVATNGSATPNLAWGLVGGKNKTTADKLGEITNLANRLILSYDILKPGADKGISFKWANLSNSTTGASAKMWLNKGTVGAGPSAASIAAPIPGDGKGEDRLNFIRGVRSKESSNGGTFRNRKNIHGDIVNSAVWYTGAPVSGYSTSGYTSFAKAYRARLPMIYVGANDGMLHGFSAENGTEKIAYVPHGVIQNLAQLTDPLYDHRYYVDGSPMSGDIDLGGGTSTDWRTYLVSTLGAGGRGYFVLDVTNPGSAAGPTATVADNFTEANAASLVIMDKTAAAVIDAAPPSKPVDPNADADIGHIFSPPLVSESNQQRPLQITRTNNNRWAFITGNGYNSNNERPVLLIQYLDGDKSLKTIPTSATACPAAVKPKGNGLSAPQFLDVNGDGTPDFVYAGDLCGNMWKFDISSSSAGDWGVAFSSSPLFTATSGSGGSSSRQPITAAPVLRTNRDVGGLMVAFGTGQNLSEGDRTDISTQTVYSILDNTRYEIESTGSNKGLVKVKASAPTPTVVSGRSELVSQSVTGGAGSGTAGSGVSASRAFWKLTTQEVTYKCEPAATGCEVKSGWYMDLPVPGERITATLDFYDGSNLLEIISEKPASGSASASGEEVCAPQPQAARPFRTIIGIASGKGPTPPILDVNGDGAYEAADKDYARMTASPKELRLSTKTEQVRKGNDGKEDRMAKLPELLLRPGWRQLK